MGATLRSSANGGSRSYLGAPFLFITHRETYENRGCEVVPVPERPATDFLWQRSPFRLYGGLYGTIEGAGIDYILPYWMGRYYGVLGE
ncbi:hypothetical protein [uncultured Paludibaculum sp.]|uniref:hypothetical protein n=1 Tax=uncultured Paludibaculum sp. TaxID=1765020 RepID=UPI002AABBC54|nr:hypothetical protein [uncultured Paludibaculum sp.]